MRLVFQGGFQIVSYTLDLESYEHLVVDYEGIVHEKHQQSENQQKDLECAHTHKFLVLYFNVTLINSIFGLVNMVCLP